MTSPARAHHFRGLLLQAVALLAMLALGSAWAATPARADGDPASDVLATQQLFLPQDAAASPAQQVQLGALLQEAVHSGYPIRVAVIASSTDLGSVTGLWSQPQTYARFLGQELGLVYHGPLLVVMPSGFGLYHIPHPATAERALAGGPSPRGGIGAAAIAAVHELAAAAGHPVALPSGAPTNADTTTGSPIPTIVFVTGAILIALAWTASLRARPLRSIAESHTTHERGHD